MAVQGIDWDEQADMYSAFSLCELDDTRTYLEAVGVREGESLLDVCCGAGRVSVAAAEMGARVTGIDSSRKMLSHARANAEERGLAGACSFRLLDWKHVLAGQNLEPADVVVASRCRAMMDVAKLSALARRRVAVQIFANAPSIPALLDVLFSGCGEDAQAAPGACICDVDAPARQAPGGGGELAQRAFGAARQGQGGPQAGGRPDAPGAREAIYLKIAGKAYEAGFDPNVRIFPERFRKAFASEEEAVAWVAALRPARAEGNMERLACNVAPFLSERGGAVDFCIATKAAIIWWDVK